MKDIIEKLLSIPKSFYVCMRLLPFREALKLPLLIRYNVKCLSLRGSVKVTDIQLAGVKIGFGHVGAFDKSYERTILQINGNILFNNNGGGISFGHGSRIIVAKNALLEINKNFSNTAMLTIVCTQSISIQSNVTVSWNTLIMDTDFHATRDTLTGKVNDYVAPITIGEGCWICTRSVILKGAVIPDGCIVGANAVVTKRFEECNTLIAGNPAKCTKQNITMIK